MARSSDSQSWVRPAVKFSFRRALPVLRGPPVAQPIVQPHRTGLRRSRGDRREVRSRTLNAIMNTALHRHEDGPVESRQQPSDLQEEIAGLPPEPVVKVYAVSSSVDPLQPWSTQPQQICTGTGFTVELGGELGILTAAHVVADSKYLEVSRAGDPRKFLAQRLKTSHECDLATLAVDDKSFWAGVEPLQFGPVPALQEEVQVVGYPEGGEGVAVTSGVVSRIEIGEYEHSGRALLALQIDAAINSGNSGGPVLNADGKVVGVAFQNMEESQNIGYVIPTPIIQHFLQDTDPADASRCQGFCSMGIFWMPLENPHMRRYHGLADDQSGVLIHGLVPLGGAKGILEKNDVLLAVDGHSVANDGSFAVGQGQQRLSFEALIHQRFPGESIPVRVLRQGQILERQIPLSHVRRLAPPTVYDEPQPYFLYGGFAFVGLTVPFLQSWGENWEAEAPPDLVNLARTTQQAQPGEQPVVLARVFPSRHTRGYSDLVYHQVVRVNGEKVLNLEQMYDRVEELKTSQPVLVFELAMVGGNVEVVWPSEVADKALVETLDLYRIPAAASPELLRRSQRPS